MIAATALVAVAACSSNGLGPSAASSHSGCPGPASITVWVSDAGTAGNALFAKTAQQYEASCPGDRVSIETYINTAIQQKLNVAMSAGQPPTVFFSWGGGVLQNYVNAGDVYNLSPSLAAHPGWQSAFLASTLAAVTFHGGIYGIPNEGTQPVLLFYNKSIFTRLHLSPPATWAELLTDIAALKQAGIAPIALGNEDKWAGLMYLEYLADRIGGPSVYSELQAGTSGAWSQPAILQALADIQQLVKAGAFEKGFDAISEGSNEPDALLYSGKAAMELMGSWLTGTISNDDPGLISDGGLGWTAFPTVPGGTGNSANLAGNVATYFVVSAKATSAQKAVAVDYLRRELSGLAYAKAAAGVGDIPVIEGSNQYFGGTKPTGFESYVYDSVAKAPSFTYSWDEALGPVLATPLYNNLADVFDLKETPAQFAAAMNNVK